MEQFQVLLVDGHVLAEGNRRGLGTADQMHPAPGLPGGVEFFHDRLVMLEGMHLREIIVADNFGETRDEGLRVIPALHILLARFTASLTSGTAIILPRLVTVDQSVGGWL